MSDRNFWLTLAGLFLLWLAMLFLGDGRVGLDRVVLDAMRNPDWVEAARWITRLGNWPATTLLAVSAASWLALRRERRRALLLLAINISGRLLVEVQKIGFGRMRPDAEGHLVDVHTLSFPSGHAANSMLILLSMALLAVPPRGRRPAVIVAVSLSLLIGLTRLVLDVHWPSDLLGGWAFGAGWTLLLVRLTTERLSPERH